MGTILPFPAHPPSRAAADAAGSAAPQIIIFPGVRIERHDASYRPPSPSLGRGRGRRARKSS